MRYVPVWRRLFENYTASEVSRFYTGFEDSNEVMYAIKTEVAPSGSAEEISIESFFGAETRTYDGDQCFDPSNIHNTEELAPMDGLDEEHCRLEWPSPAPADKCGW